MSQSTKVDGRGPGALEGLLVCTLYGTCRSNRLTEQTPVVYSSVGNGYWRAGRLVCWFNTFLALLGLVVLVWLFDFLTKASEVASCQCVRYTAPAEATD